MAFDAQWVHLRRRPWRAAPEGTARPALSRLCLPFLREEFATSPTSTIGRAADASACARCCARPRQRSRADRGDARHSRCSRYAATARSTARRDSARQRRSRVEFRFRLAGVPMTATTTLFQASCADDYDPNSMPVDRARALIRQFLTPVDRHRARAHSLCARSRAGRRPWCRRSPCRVTTTRRWTAGRCASAISPRTAKRR